jgi:hypothetical protein
MKTRVLNFCQQLQILLVEIYRASAQNGQLQIAHPSVGYSCDIRGTENHIKGWPEKRFAEWALFLNLTRIGFSLFPYPRAEQRLSLSIQIVAHRSF